MFSRNTTNELGTKATTKSTTQYPFRVLVAAQSKVIQLWGVNWATVRFTLPFTSGISLMLRQL